MSGVVGKEEWEGEFEEKRSLKCCHGFPSLFAEGSDVRKNNKHVM